MRLTLMTLVLVLLAACGLRQPDSITAPDGTVIANPVEYNNYFIARQQAVLTAMSEFSSQLESFDVPVIQQAHKGLLSAIEEQRTLISNTPAFDSDTILQPAFLRLFDFYRSISTQEYGTIVTIIGKGEEQITQQDLVTIDSLTKAINLQKIKTDAAFDKAQQAFAKVYGLEIGAREKE